MRGRSKARGLTERQRRFVDEYILDGNATQAAIRAGFKRNSASVQASRLIGNVKVALAIRQRRAAIAKRMEVSAERVIAEYAKIAFDDGAPVRKEDKLGALNALGKHLGLFVDRHEHDLGARLSDALTTIKARLSSSAQEELVRAIGHVLATAVAPTAGEPSSEPNG
jgi:hypothetical protein